MKAVPLGVNVIRPVAEVVVVAEGATDVDEVAGPASAEHAPTTMANARTTAIVKV